MSIRCIAIDDEPLALEVIASHAEKVTCLELVATFRNAIHAFDFLQKESDIDLIFLDIQMPKLTGLDFLKVLKNPPEVIFTTAYRDYALEGFELDALDYLLKPISLERFLKGVSKFKNRRNEQLAPPLPEKENHDFIFFKSEKKNIKIRFKDIIYIESVKDYIKIVLEEKEVVTHFKIGEIAEKLPSDNFLRVHRSFIVQIPKIEAYSATEIELCKHTVPIGRNYKQEVFECLKKIVL